MKRKRKKIREQELIQSIYAMEQRTARLPRKIPHGRVTDEFRTYSRGKPRPIPGVLTREVMECTWWDHVKRFFRRMFK